MDRADVGRYLAGDLALILLLGWLFYDSLVSVIVLFPGMLWMLREQKKEQAEVEKELREEAKEKAEKEI